MSNLVTVDQDSVAQATTKVRECCAECAIHDIANNLANLFEADNPNFDRAKFFEVSGISDDGNY